MMNRSPYYNILESNDKNEGMVELSRAIPLLAEAMTRLDDALKSSREGERFLADDHIQRFAAILPELFCCRALVDGFGACVTAMFHALQNTRGAPLAERQVIAIHEVVRAIRNEPFISMDAAAHHIDGLEEAELVPTPIEFEYLADVLDA